MVSKASGMNEGERYETYVLNAAIVSSMVSKCRPPSVLEGIGSDSKPRGLRETD